MNEINRQKVLEYISQCDCSPLYFNKYESPKDEFNPDKYTVDDMVRRTLILTKNYASYNNDDMKETSSNRFRSVVDIWRHITYYYPTIEIFDVMHSLYNIKEELGGQYCNDVHRRVFKWNKNDWDCTHSRHQEPNAMKLYTWMSRTTDEFGLEWQEWKDI